ncbi:hypothetical protein E3T26_09165 [Cryobacterium sp. TMT1-21]|uniref:Uncharacterized protein n=1 Tax=Cryobacterium shii TaxID=1259235 RepID=A0AAQ2HH98_9MICO|nr:hypothetical protein E3O49_01065 [Cryobacterium shii]TFC81513.1 hypothetical protein E3T24_15255 [Cryobacterium sp. TmT2-59]TFD13968.1 hypothetical protein E3T42_12795 [Cryobacterium sp. TMT4-10]TFD13995.1 hypothetical protein E3T26_09165 [Cryobacterium sp. TMT1-21]TFD18284.1 hypothetical protein E3T32_12575 [Cryobacterium sp. TMT2-23]TFD42837.1 hypothetical protein E3T37_01895 [Cryobacterium sp. TMT2-10]
MKAVAKVVDRLVERFPHSPRPSFGRAVLEEHKALDGRPIREYVPVLVEHRAKGRLRLHDATKTS